jgi:magnesium-transporting ATPase (P-type)
LQDNNFAIEETYINKERVVKYETNIPFGPIRKRQVVAYKANPDSNSITVVVKGAPEYILPMCTKQIL